MDQKTIDDCLILDEFRDYSVLRDVVFGRTAFRDQIRSFYDMAWNDTLLLDKPEKYCNLPDDLGIMQRLSGNRLDQGLLIYEHVRADYVSASKYARGSANYFLMGVVGIASGLSFSVIENFVIGVPLFLAGAASVYTFLKREAQREGMFKANNEYHKLLNTAIRTDNFIQNQYRNYLIEKSLGEK
jgi:hypothetical protein